MAESGYDIDFSKAMVLEPTTLADWLIIAPVATAVTGAALTMMLRKNVKYQAFLGVLLLGLIFVQCLGLFARVLELGPITMVMGKWLPPFGIAFTVDWVGATFALTASAAALAAGIYASTDAEMPDRRYGFYPFLLMTMAGVNGAFMTGDIFNLYVWFEVLLISSFGMLILGSRDVQLDGAVKYAFLNLLATTFFLAAVAYLYGLTGTLNMADITIRLQELPDGAPVGTLAVLFTFAFAMKAAAFPVNFWLPASYHAPRISAAAIFAGLMTKVGFYALARTLIMIMDPEQTIIVDVIAVIAALTMITGVLGALSQSDVRRIFGFLVISGIGTMLAGLAIASEESLAGAFLYAVHSILVMTALYLAAGMMNNLGGSFSLNRNAGLYRASSVLSICFFILFLAVAGLPPFSGFLPKIMLVSASLNADLGWLAAVILVAGLLTTIAVSRVWILTFWRPTTDPSVVVPASASSAAVATAHLDDEHPPSANTNASYFALLLLVALITWLGFQPELFLAALNNGATVFLEPSSYVDSVFGGTR